MRRLANSTPVCLAVHLAMASLLGAVSICAAAPSLTLRVDLDATQVARGRLVSHLSIPVSPGPLTLVTPKWIPGEHSPSGPIDLMIGLDLRTPGGDVLRWQRDPLNLYSFHLVVPAGTTTLQARLDIGLPTPGGDFLTRRRSTTELAAINWHPLLLYPANWPDARQVKVESHLEVPAGWAVTGATSTTTLAGLIDSPVQVGRHQVLRHVVPVAADRRVPHTLSVVGDHLESLSTEGMDTLQSGLGRLAMEGPAALGTAPFASYTWLLSLSDAVGAYGLEHANSSDNGMYADSLGTPDGLRSTGALLAHEYVHAWNGKSRRPAGLFSPTYQEPMDGTLLWVYEGLTQFWGDVLATRSGMLDETQYRELLAYYAGEYTAQPGTRWRTLEDTATAVAPGYDFPEAWSSWRRGVEFYDASTFLWLEVDAELRERTQGRIGIDDFSRRFLQNGTGEVSLYTDAEVYRTLAAIAPSTTAQEWESVIARQLRGRGVEPMLAGLERTGWKLAWSAEPNWWVGVREGEGGFLDRRWSLGVTLGEDGTLGDVVGESPAEAAGLMPGEKILGVDGRLYSAEALDAAIVRSPASKAVRLLVENGGAYREVVVRYSGGERFPHLERVSGSEDRLAAVVKPHGLSAPPPRT